MGFKPSNENEWDATRTLQTDHIPPPASVLSCEVGLDALDADACNVQVVVLHLHQARAHNQLVRHTNQCLTYQEHNDQFDKIKIQG